jgi:hypothetical protein
MELLSTLTSDLFNVNKKVAASNEAAIFSFDGLPL